MQYETTIFMGTLVFHRSHSRTQCWTNVVGTITSHLQHIRSLCCRSIRFKTSFVFPVTPPVPTYPDPITTTSESITSTKAPITPNTNRKPRSHVHERFKRFRVVRERHCRSAELQITRPHDPYVNPYCITRHIQANVTSFAFNQHQHHHHLVRPVSFTAMNLTPTT